MAKSDTRYTTLKIVNQVQKLLGVDETAELDTNRQTEVILQFVNQTLDQLSDAGDWQELIKEVTVTASTGQSTYTLASAGVNYPLKSIYEIAYATRPMALFLLEIQELNRLARTGGQGEPRHFTIKGVDVQGNPKFQVYPVPTTAQNGDLFTITLYAKPRYLDINSQDDELEFPGNLVILGTYARMLEEENGGTQTDESKKTWLEFRDQIKESLNRFNGDTGTDYHFQPVSQQ